MLDADGIRNLISDDPIGSGLEHRVGGLRKYGRVVKDYNTSEGSPLFPRRRSVESLFDYLTDHMLSNELFGDDVKLEGFYQKDGNLHIIVTQPFIEGIHPDKETLLKELRQRGMMPTGENQFSYRAGKAGTLTVTDLHEDNAILASAQDNLVIIDAHFYFPSREDRVAALKKLGALSV